MLKKELNSLSLNINEEMKKVEEKYKRLVEEKDRIIGDLKSKLSSINIPEPKNNNGLLGGEKLVIVNFRSADENINYSITCKSDMEFHDIESQLYKKYPEYRKRENNFMFKEKKIDRFDTLEDIGIIEYVIMVNKIEK